MDAIKYYQKEINELTGKLIIHIEHLYNIGHRLDSDKFLTTAYSVGWDDGDYYNCVNIDRCSLNMSDDGFLCFEYFPVCDDISFGSKLDCLTIETLMNILKSLNFKR